MKTLGAVLILLSGLGLGLWGAGRLKRRVEALLDLRRVIQSFRTGISFSQLPLCELVRREKDSRFCRLAVEDQAFLFDPAAALERAGERVLRKPEDIALFRGFARGLGESGSQGQLEHLALYGALLENSLEKAREDRERGSRLSVCLGLFGGAVLCLILL